MSGVTIEAQQLTRRFGARTAVHEVSFTAREGEVVGLLGPNGAGKTTTIRLLSTVLTPSGGKFTVAGIPHTRPADIRRRIGVLPESAGYPAHHSGLGYLRYHARLFGHSRRSASAVAERLLGEVGLAERATSPISGYSRGMRQRLGIARSLVNEPAVLFLDEPTLGLDPAGQRQVLGLVRDIAGRGTTVVLSTHALSEVEQTCSTVLILHRGRVMVSGATGEVTRAVATRPPAKLRVPAAVADRAREALAGVTGVRVRATAERPDVLTISATGPGDSADGMNAALLAVLRADVPVLSFEVDGARLSDAFLAMTREGDTT